MRCWCGMSAVYTDVNCSFRITSSSLADVKLECPTISSTPHTQSVLPPDQHVQWLIYLGTTVSSL